MIELTKGDMGHLAGKATVFCRLETQEEQKIMAVFLAVAPLDFIEKFGLPRSTIEQLKEALEALRKKLQSLRSGTDTPYAEAEILKTFCARIEVENEEAATRNTWILDRVAEVIREHDDYSVNIEIHAVSIYWQDPERARTEQMDVLLPLTQARAETLKDLLMSRGIDPERITPRGFGGEKPLVPHSDLENRWKNRRVEFILVK